MSEERRGIQLKGERRTMKRANSESDLMANSERPLAYYTDRSTFALALKAASDKDLRFVNLMHHVTEERLEKVLWKMSKQTASGPDKLSRDETLESLSWIWKRESKNVHKKKYQAPAARQVYIPKGDGKQRPLAIGNIFDRALQKSVSEVLSNIYEQDFLKCSYGYRPKKNCHQALKRVYEVSTLEDQRFVLEVDLENFFGTLNHGWLRKFIKHRVGDKRVLSLIDSWLKAGILEGEELHVNEVGTPQGGAISPLLANIYLHYVLDLWFEKAVKPKLRGKATLVRWADDFMILCEVPSDRDLIEKALKIRLEQFSLKISKEKSRKVNLGDSRKGHPRSLKFLGFTIYLAKKKTGRGKKIVFKTSSKKLGKAKEKLKEQLYKRMHLPLEEQGKYLRSVMRGHFNYFGLPGNNYSISKFHHIGVRYWRRILSRRTRDKVVSWEEFNKILDTHLRVLPRLRYGYRKFNEVTS